VLSSSLKTTGIFNSWMVFHLVVRAKKIGADINSSPTVESIKGQLAKVNNSDAVVKIKETTGPMVSAVGSVGTNFVTTSRAMFIFCK